MKPIVILVTAFALFASSAQAGDRLTVETALTDTASQASSDMTAAVEAFKADDSTTGCAKLILARDGMVKALDLVAEDKVLVEADTTTSAESHQQDLNDLSKMQDEFINLRDRMTVQLDKRC